MKTTIGWQLSESIAAELDMALGLALSESFRELVPELSQALERLPADWYDQGHELLRGLAGDFFSVLKPWAAIADVLASDDYSSVTMRLREMDAAALGEAIRRSAAQISHPLDGVDDPHGLLVELLLAMRQRVDLPFPPGSQGLRKLQRECRLIVDVTRDGPLHTHFWHWIDRFYYQTYQPWRLTRSDFLKAERERARVALGAYEGSGSPDLEWLPSQNPLSGAGRLNQRIIAGEEQVIFWSEPFGTWDVLDLTPHGVLASFGEPGEAQELFRQRAAQIAGGLKALADPTRLTMLRIVRQLEVDNSEIAEYMELSHPTVSVHARVLREASLLHSRRQGRRLFHTLDPDALRQLLRSIEGFLGVREE